MYVRTMFHGIGDANEPALSPANIATLGLRLHTCCATPSCSPYRPPQDKLSRTGPQHT